jgi:hypothetical protein
MLWSSLLALTALVQAAPQGRMGGGGNGGTAMLRFGCSQAVIERLDPYVTQSLRREKKGKLILPSLVDPNVNPSPHVHQVVGGVRIMPRSLSSST